MSEPGVNLAVEKCPRCGYALRGLPACHACPECGLRYDERSEVYRDANPKRVLLIWGAIFGGGWMNLKGLPILFHLDAASGWEWFRAIAAALWLVCVVVGMYPVCRLYRRGQMAAAMVDGLLVRTLGFPGGLIPWGDIGGAVVKEQAEGKPQIAKVYLKSRGKYAQVGGLSNVFPTRDDVERFVGQVNERVGHTA